MWQTELKKTCPKTDERKDSTPVFIIILYCRELHVYIINVIIPSNAPNMPLTNLPHNLMFPCSWKSTKSYMSMVVGPITDSREASICVIPNAHHVHTQ